MGDFKGFRLTGNEKLSTCAEILSKVAVAQTETATTQVDVGSVFTQAIASTRKLESLGRKMLLSVESTLGSIATAYPQAKIDAEDAEEQALVVDSICSIEDSDLQITARNLSNKFAAETAEGPIHLAELEKDMTSLKSDLLALQERVLAIRQEYQTSHFQAAQDSGVEAAWSVNAVARNFSRR